MNALVLLHAGNEGPGTLGAFLREKGVSVATLNLYDGDGLPPDTSGVDLIVSMGGPMNVYEDVKYPFLKEESAFLAKAVKLGVPVLGICLGAQLIARAAGARVYRAPVGETGWGTVSLTAAGREDEVTGVLPPVLPVLQWHEDTFDIPEGGWLLATSDACSNQAFRVGNALGLQFHVEVDREMLADWFGGKKERHALLRRYDELHEEFDKGARRLYEALLLQAEGGRDG